MTAAKWTITLEGADNERAFVRLKNPHTSGLVDELVFTPGVSQTVYTSGEQGFEGLSDVPMAGMTYDAALPHARNGACISRKGHRQGSHIVEGRVTISAHGKDTVRDAFIYVDADGVPQHEFIPTPQCQSADDWEIVDLEPVDGGVDIPAEPKLVVA